MELEKLLRCVGFEWDSANVEKNWLKHKTTSAECEQIFFNQPLVVADDKAHSRKEARFYALGQTDVGRPLFVVFTARNDLIRVISARPMSKKERSVYKTL